MNYRNLYKRFISSRPIRVKPPRLDGSLCVHHILPRSIGGTDSKDNLIVLTPKEHYFAHKLLYKFNTGLAKSKMAGALLRMMHDPKVRGIISSKRYAIEYEKSRQYNKEQAKSHWQDSEYRRKWYRARYGKEAPIDWKPRVVEPKYWPHSTDNKTRIELLKKKWIQRRGSISHQQKSYLKTHYNHTL